jgi:hypothetical protein
MPVCDIRVKCITKLAASALPGGLDPYVYYAKVNVHFQVLDSVLSSQLFPLRVDTGSHISMLPQRWFAGKETLIGPLSRHIDFTTTAGAATASGRMARKVPIYFEGENRIYMFDFLITNNLIDFGLLSLRDIHNHFQVRQTHRPVISPTRTSAPLKVGNLVLTPWP